MGTKTSTLEKSGWRSIEMPAGVRRVQRADGALVDIYSDGRLVVRLSDGTIVDDRSRVSGTKTTMFADGTTIVQKNER